MDTSADTALLDSAFPAQRIALADGSQLAVRRCGDARAPAVVLLHGISSGAASWLHTALRLDGLQAIAWDAPGYGDSSPLAAAEPTDADYAVRLEALLQALDLRRCLLVGHSLGALMAAAHARIHGAARGARLVLISPAGGYGQDGNAAARERVQRERLAALDQHGVAGLAAAIDQRLLSPEASDAQRAWVRWNTARLHAGGYRQAVALLCASDLGRAQGLAQPVEVHCGAADVVTPPEACRRWAERLGAPYAEIAGAGHASPIEQPQAVARLIAQAAARIQGDAHHA
ncbi:alpha/beta fold hydrolase [Pseudorhodoferax sp.]|uniref:alpha/beta fold hydrolase n=1 Tax=Pseudorhodoferax sp. TaxID=1993553 RepID=UPI002DD64B92|nr:alpha/beta fold hydrolase [Pseudorhodoferax sp.]